jgi:hypothetical protein
MYPLPLVGVADTTRDVGPSAQVRIQTGGVGVVAWLGG